MEMKLVLPCYTNNITGIDDGMAVFKNTNGRIEFKIVDTFGLNEPVVARVVLSDANVGKLALALHQWQCRNLD